MKDSLKKNLLEDDSDDSSVGSSSSASSSSSSSSASDNVKLTVNKKFARDYQSRKQREELQRMRERDEDFDSEESSSEEEDEDGNLLTNSMNLQFVKTIKALRKKEKSIYDPSTQFFKETPGEDKRGGTDKKKEKPKHFKDVLREQILDQMDEEENRKEESATTKSKFAYDEQQEEIRKSFLKMTEDIDEDQGENQDDNWMVVKSKTSVTTSDDKEVMEEFNEIEKMNSSQIEKDQFVDPRGEVKDGDKYLLDFFKNKKWIDKDDVYDDEGHDYERTMKDDDSLEDLDRADDFESNYNFRFEQAAAEASTSGASLSVQTYARGQTMNTIRRMDTTRKDKRQARKERKAAERKAKEEQLKRLKNAKREETNRKMAQIKSVLSEVDHEAVDEVAIMKMLEGDYDPEKFEKAMNEAYGDNFYEKEETEWKTDLDVRENLKNDKEGEGVIGRDDVDGGMYDTYADEGPEDYPDNDGEDDEEEWPEEEDMVDDSMEETELEKKLKSKMQEELYKLDYEDIVAGMPTRFKYRQVEANDYGLSTQEILLARDSTLKQFVSLKKMAPYNEGNEYAVSSKKRRRFREGLKQDFKEENEDYNEMETEEQQKEEEVETVEPKKKKRRRLKKGKKKEKEASTDQKESSEPVEATKMKPSDADVEFDTQKRRRRKKKGKKPSPSEDVETVEQSEEVSSKEALSAKRDLSTTVDRKKKRKKRKKEIVGLSASRLSSYGL